MTYLSYLVTRYFHAVEIPRYKPERIGTATRYGVSIALHRLAYLEHRGFTLDIADIQKVLAADPVDLANTAMWGMYLAPASPAGDFASPARRLLLFLAKELGGVSTPPNTNDSHVTECMERMSYAVQALPQAGAGPLMRLGAVSDVDSAMERIFNLLASESDSWDDAQANDAVRIASYLRSQIPQKGAVYPKNLATFSPFRKQELWSFRNLENMVFFSRALTGELGVRGAGAKVIIADGAKVPELAF